MNNLNTLYLVFNNLDAYIEETGENTCLIFASTKKNKIILRIYKKLWDEVKEQIELITENKMIKYNKDFMKISFKTNDDLSLSKIINVYVCVVIVSNVVKENDKYYPQVLLHDCFYEYEENINPPVL